MLKIDKKRLSFLVLIFLLGVASCDYEKNVKKSPSIIDSEQETILPSSQIQSSGYNFRNQTEIITVPWLVYLPPRDWPINNETESDTLVNFSFSTHYGSGAQAPFYHPSRGYISGAEVLDWAQKTDQGIDFLLPLWCYNPQYPTLPRYEDYDSCVRSIVFNFSNHLSYHGVNIGDEPYLNRGTPEITGFVLNLFRMYNNNKNHRYYFNTDIVTVPFMRHCREANPDIMLSSGDQFLRDPFIPLNGSLFKEHHDKKIKIFDDSYLCTENYGIPFGYTIATNYWGGEMNPNEARMLTYSMLAHGGKFVLWFLYWGARGYGLAYYGDTSYPFFYWVVIKPTEFINITVDNTSAHSGIYSAKIESRNSPYGVNFLGNNFYIDTEDVALPLFLRGSVNYSLSVWIKKNCNECNASIKIGTCTNCSYWAKRLFITNNNIVYECPKVTEPATEWFKVSCSFITPTYSTWFPWWVFLTFESVGNATVWYDDVSLYDNDIKHEVLSVFNPGFEFRKSRNPGLPIVRPLNIELKQLSRELMPLKRFEASNNNNIPTKSLIKSIDVSLENNLDAPLIEYGLFTDSDVNGKVYLILVNRVIVDNATAIVTLNLNNYINPVNILTNENIPKLVSRPGTQRFQVKLKPGDGVVLRLDGLRYFKESEGRVVYFQDFESQNALSDFIADSGYSIVNSNGNNLLLANASSSTQNVWLRSYNFSDFMISGSFKIINFNDSSESLFQVSFRQPQQTSSRDSYIFSILPDRPDRNLYYYYDEGKVKLIPDYNPDKTYVQYDQKFLQDRNWHSFKIKAYGGKIETYIDDLKYIEFYDNNIINSGFIGISTTSGNELYFDDIEISEIIPNSNIQNKRIRTGAIEINTNPIGVDVYLDGVYRGISPLTIKNVHRGNHTVFFTKKFYNNSEIEINLNANEFRKVNLTLELLPIGDILVRVFPANAYLYFDNESEPRYLDGLGYTFIENIAIGTYNITAVWLNIVGATQNITKNITVIAGKINFIVIDTSEIPTLFPDKIDLKIELLSADSLPPLLSPIGLAIYIQAPSREGLIIEPNGNNETQSWAGSILTSEKKTREIWLYIDLSNAKYNATMLFYYDNELRNIVYAGNLTDSNSIGTVKFAYINFNDNKKEDRQLLISVGGNITVIVGARTHTFGILNITLRIKGSENNPMQISENLTTLWRLSDDGTISSLGIFNGVAEPIDLVHTYQENSINIGTLNQDYTTIFNVSVANPLFYSSNDKEQFTVPKHLILNACQDGTLKYHCSEPPNYCDSSLNLIPQCSRCGCNFNEICQEEGTCRSSFELECQDGTLYDSCSTNIDTGKPYYCDKDGNLVPRCSVCGCDFNEICQEDGTCEPTLRLPQRKETFESLESPRKSLLDKISFYLNRILSYIFI